jgi:acyl-CoA-binding protein
MLGRAKWDSWNKQKGKDKDEAKYDYVVALLRVRLLAKATGGKTADGK